jgi:hypothetical protein
MKREAYAAARTISPKLHAYFARVVRILNLLEFAPVLYRTAGINEPTCRECWIHSGSC